MRMWLALAVVGALAAYANDTGIDNTPAEVAAAAYVAPGPKSISLITVVNNRSGSGGHSALVINGSQQVIFDPAGSFRDPRVSKEVTSCTVCRPSGSLPINRPMHAARIISSHSKFR